MASRGVRRLLLAASAGLLVAAAVVLARGALSSDDAPLAVAEPESTPAMLGSLPVLPVARLVGGCVDARTLAPLAGCKVRVDGWWHGMTEPSSTQQSLAVVTGADGTFQAEFTPLPHLTYELVATAEAHAVLGRTCGTIAPGARLDLGVLQLRRGAVLTGRVVDTRGAARDGVQLRLEHDSISFDPHAQATATSSADGSFAFENGLLPGTWTLDLRTAALQAPLTIEIGDDGTRVDVRVVVFADGEVAMNSGKVVDEDGNPVANAFVAASRNSETRTDARGRFRHPCGPAARWGGRGPVAYYHRASGYESVLDERRYAPGTSDITLRVRRQPFAVDFALLSDYTGEPIEAYDVVCARQVVEAPGAGFGPFGPPGWRQVATSRGPHAAGVAHLQGLTADAHVLVLQPKDRKRWSLVGPVTIHGRANLPPQTIRARVLTTRALECVLPDGKPVVSSLVELLLPLHEPITLASAAVGDLRDWQSAPEGLHAVAVQTARTDECGTLTLIGPADTSLALRILGPGHRPQVVSSVRLNGDPLRVIVTPGGTIVGRLPARLHDVFTTSRGHRTTGAPGSTPDRYSLARWPSQLGWPSRSYGFGLELRAADHGRLRADGTLAWHRLPAMNYLFPIDAEGGFRIDGIEPGDWEVILSAPSGDLDAVSLSLGEVGNLKDGGWRPLDLDTTWLEPGELRGSVSIDGSPLAHRPVALFAEDLHWTTGRLEQELVRETDAHGLIVAKLLPGTWRLAVLAQGIPSSHSHPWVKLPTEVKVLPRATTTAEFACTRRRLTVRVTDAHDQPRRFQEITVRAGDSHLSVFTDCEGRFVLDPCLADELVLWTAAEHPQDPSHREHRLRVPSAPKDVEVTLRYE